MIHHHSEYDPCETCGESAQEACFDCHDPLCATHALPLAGSHGLLFVCGDCRDKRAAWLLLAAGEVVPTVGPAIRAVFAQAKAETEAA
jgi:hypothetical protein